MYNADTYQSLYYFLWGRVSVRCLGSVEQVKLATLKRTAVLRAALSGGEKTPQKHSKGSKMPRWLKTKFTKRKFPPPPLQCTHTRVSRASTARNQAPKTPRYTTSTLWDLTVYYTSDPANRQLRKPYCNFGLKSTGHWQQNPSLSVIISISPCLLPLGQNWTKHTLSWFRDFSLLSTTEGHFE